MIYSELQYFLKKQNTETKINRFEVIGLDSYIDINLYLTLKLCTEVQAYPTVPILSKFREIIKIRVIIAFTHKEETQRNVRTKLSTQ